MTTAALSRIQTSAVSPPNASMTPIRSGCAFSPLLATLFDSGGDQAEAIRAIRTHVMAQHVGRGRRALAMCAASKGVGCTFVATNLAVSLSQIGVKTILIDGDLHHPGVSELIRPETPSPGLAACLASRAPFSDAIDYDVMPGLSMITAGQPVENARELLAGDRFQMLMDFCLRDFDMTIVDTPPANGSSDVRRISAVLGYSLIVAGSNRTYVKDVKTLADQLCFDHAKVLGTVLNWA